MQLIAYVDVNLYKQLYATSKEELSKRNVNKWKDYELNVEASILEKIRMFNPIEG